MRCRIIECSELTIKNGSCDPFATVTVIYSNGKQISKRTKVKKKTASPRFNETFVFEVRKYIVLLVFSLYVYACVKYIRTCGYVHEIIFFFIL